MPSAPNPSADVDRIEALIEQMTLAEKVGQMTQVALHHHDQDPERFENLLANVARGQVGSFLNARDLEQRNRLQRAAVEGGRLGIPLIFGRDVIHGYRTIFPIPLALAASFHPELAERVAAATALEASESGIDWTFAPMVDVTREPRWGRVAEGFGEDPWLTSRLGAAMVRGFQGQDASAHGRVAACAKHYLAYGAAEAGKEYNSTWVAEAQLRDVFLPPFRACVEAGVETVMCGFNDLNGVPMSAHGWALRDVLKGELGFSGFVVSDWGSVRELTTHGLCEDDRQAAGEAARAGLDMEMATGAFASSLESLVESEEVPSSVLNEAVRRILRVKLRLGLFERPYARAPAASVALCAAHRELAREAARECLVLLDNRGKRLPLPPEPSQLAVIGPLADDADGPLGCWSFDGDRSATQTLTAALRHRLGSERVEYCPGLPDCRSLDESGFAEAVKATRVADLALVVLGEDATLSGEARSRSCLDLPGAQALLLERLAETGTPIVLVVLTGRPLCLGAACELASATLLAWHPGTMWGPALVDVLFGDAPPVGKLPISFPRNVGQVPIYYAHKRTGRPPRVDFRGIPTGTPLDPVDMDASYLDVEVTPQFAFGHGLSYATFAYRDLSVSPARVRAGDAIEVRVTVSNVGACEGTEVAQLYVRDRVGSLTRPVRELRGVERVSLKAGESRAIRFRLPVSSLAFCGRDLQTRVEPGTFDVFVGGDSRATLGASFEF